MLSLRTSRRGSRQRNGTTKQDCARNKAKLLKENKLMLDYAALDVYRRRHLRANAVG